jgi:hypothetical protein
MTTNEHHAVHWEAPEFQFYQKGVGWYLTFIIFLVLIVGYQIVLRDWFGAISLAVIGLFVGWFSTQKPSIVEIAITNKGIHSGNIFIPFSAIRHFWIVDTPHHRTVNLETTAYLNKLQILELAQQNAEAVRQALLPYIPELPNTEETLAQRVMHRFKL